MKKAFSQIAWSQPEAPALELLQEHGFHGVEVAPTKIWPDWGGATPHMARIYRQSLEARGLSVPALQAVLFGKPEAQLFGTLEQQVDFVEHLAKVAELANALESPVVVLGAPKNRLRYAIPLDEAQEEAQAVFGALGDLYASYGTCLCLEANPVEYGCDFLTTTAEVKAFVNAVGSPGLGLHIDTAQLFMGQENLASFVADPDCPIRHAHLSEPFLAPLDASAKVPHKQNMALLAEAGYPNWVSVEMRESPNALDAIRAALCHLA